jgi:hypothetical protein
MMVGVVTQKTALWISYGLLAGEHYRKIISVFLHVSPPKLLNEFQ